MVVPVASVSRLQLSFRTGDTIVPAGRDASLHVDPGEAVGLVGESGSGKSTVARALMWLNPVAITTIGGGEIRIAGQDVTRYDPASWERLRGHPLAMVF